MISQIFMEWLVTASIDGVALFLIFTISAGVSLGRMMSGGLATPTIKCNCKD